MKRPGNHRVRIAEDADEEVFAELSLAPQGTQPSPTSGKSGRLFDLKRFSPARVYRAVRDGTWVRRGKRRENFEFMAPVAEVLETPPSSLRIGVASAICLLAVLALIIAWVGHVDIYAIAPGRIQPAGRSKIVQPFALGAVRAIHVQEGSEVKAGAPLLELDPTSAEATHASASATVSSLDAEIARRQAALAAMTRGDFRTVPAVSFMPDTNATYRAREMQILTADLIKLSSDVELLRAKADENVALRRSVEETIASEQRVIDTLQQRLRMRTDLERQGWETRANVLDATESLQREYDSLTQKQGQLLQAAAAANSYRRQSEQTVSEFVAQYTQALAKAQNERDHAVQDLIKAGSNVDYTMLRAPLDGSVQQLTVTTIGQVVAPGQQLMTIVPARSKLEIEALVQSQDIGFVRVGQMVIVKVDAFPFTRYGTINGIVTHISRDSLQSGLAQATGDTQKVDVSTAGGAVAPLPQTQQLVFPVKVMLDTSAFTVDGRAMPLSPGMTSMVEIKTGERRLLEYFLSNLVRVQSEAAHER